MKTTVSKTVIAYFGGPGLLQEQFFKNVRERAFGRDDNYSADEESGINRTKKTIISVPGYGSNDRGHNPGAGMGLGRDENESKNKSVGSGYNDGGQPDDETGPGNSPGGVDEYFTSEWDNELFSDLELKSQESGRDKQKTTRTHLKTLLEGTPLALKTKKHPVDTLRR